MAGYNFEKLKILIADDNQHMRRLINTIMQAFGVQRTFEAESGETALQIMQTNSIDIAIVDWQMEGMSGIEFVHQIRNAPDSPNPFLPIIMLTGHTQIDHVRQARDTGANEFLAKPITAKDLMAKIVSVVENPRPFIRTKTYFGPCRRRRNDFAYRGPERRSQSTKNVVDLDDEDIPPMPSGHHE